MLFEALFAAGTTVLREFVRCTAVEVIRHTVEVIRHWAKSRSNKDSSSQQTNSSYIAVAIYVRTYNQISSVKYVAEIFERYYGSIL